MCSSSSTSSPFSLISNVGVESDYGHLLAEVIGGLSFRVPPGGDGLQPTSEPAVAKDSASRRERPSVCSGTWSATAPAHAGTGRSESPDPEELRECGLRQHMNRLPHEDQVDVEIEPEDRCLDPAQNVVVASQEPSGTKTAAGVRPTQERRPLARFRSDRDRVELKITGRQVVGREDRKCLRREERFSEGHRRVFAREQWRARPKDCGRASVRLGREICLGVHGSEVRSSRLSSVSPTSCRNWATTSSPSIICAR